MKSNKVKTIEEIGSGKPKIDVAVSCFDGAGNPEFVNRALLLNIGGEKEEAIDLLINELCLDGFHGPFIVFQDEDLISLKNQLEISILEESSSYQVEILGKKRA